MIIEVPNKKSIVNELRKIMDESVFQVLNSETITKIRDEFHQIVKKAKRYSVDISDIFPLGFTTGGGYAIKFYQNGDVYMFEPNHNIVQLHSNYESDSICQYT